MWAEWPRRIDAMLLGSVITLRAANKALRQTMSKCCYEQFAEDGRLERSEEDLSAGLALSIGRLERVENKAMGTLLGVAVAIAVFGAASGVFGSDGVLAGSCSALRIVAAVLVLATMLYQLGSGLLALGAYEIGPVFRPTLFDGSPIVEEGQAKSILLYCIEQNERAATLRSNRLSASFSCLRNGLVTVLLLGGLVVVVSLIESTKCNP